MVTFLKYLLDLFVDFRIFFKFKKKIFSMKTFSPIKTTSKLNARFLMAYKLNK